MVYSSSSSSCCSRRQDFEKWVVKEESRAHQRLTPSFCSVVRGCVGWGWAIECAPSRPGPWASSPVEQMGVVGSGIDSCRPIRAFRAFNSMQNSMLLKPLRFSFLRSLTQCWGTSSSSPYSSLYATRRMRVNRIGKVGFDGSRVESRVEDEGSGGEG